MNAPSGGHTGGPSGFDSHCPSAVVYLGVLVYFHLNKEAVYADFMLVAVNVASTLFHMSSKSQICVCT